MTRSYPLAVWTGLLLTGCAHFQRIEPVAAGFNVSSADSDYSPVAQLAVHLPVLPSDSSGDSIVVSIDSAIVSAPGVRAVEDAPAMRHLHLTLLLATEWPDQQISGVRRPWRVLAESDSLMLADALRLGETRAVGGLRLVVRRPETFDPARTWIVFRITGTAITSEVRSSDGRVVSPRRVVGDGVRVYACANWSLAGYVNRDRARAMAEAYTAAC